MSSISNFKITNEDRKITKVRVSTDGGNSWGILYEGNPVIRRYIKYDPEVVVHAGGCLECYEGDCEHMWLEGWRGNIYCEIVEEYLDGSSKIVDEEGIETNDYRSSGIYHEEHTLTYAGVSYPISVDVKVINSDDIQV